MSYSDIKELCKNGLIGVVPGWNGYLKWNKDTDTLLFENNNYIMTQDELEGNYGIINRLDLFCI